MEDIIALGRIIYVKHKSCIRLKTVQLRKKIRKCAVAITADFNLTAATLSGSEAVASAILVIQF